jgi:hypothetical protein
MQIEWRPGIGDPTLAGWLTVVIYFAAAAACLLAACRSQVSGRNWQQNGMFWLFIAFLLVALGINKQLDLQSLFTELARSAAKGGGWYERRRTYQRAFIVIVGGSGIFAAVTLILWARGLGIAQQMAVFGLSSLVAFIAIRAASFHHVDEFISGTIIGARWSSLLEIIGAVTIGLSALGYTRMSVRPQRRR